MKRRHFVAIFVLLALIAAACGGEGDRELTDDVLPTAEPEVEVEEAAPEETEEDTEPEATVPPTGPVEPLTGLDLDDESIMDRPALMVKIDNSPQARPQIGLNEADIGIELLVEGITRLALVFHSTDSEPVGPIRSGRSSDPDLAANFGTPLFAWSGGNPTVRGEVRQGEVEGKLYDVGFDQIPNDYFRDPGRNVAYEHTLFSTTPALFAAAPEELGPPPQIFQYVTEGVEREQAGTPIPGIQIAWRGGVVVNWVWDETSGGWLRYQRGTPHVDGEGTQVAPPNVVIFTTPYGTSAADAGSPQALTVGTGSAMALVDGVIIEGTWNRPAASDPWELTDTSGNPILLNPGQTWIGLPEEGDVTVMTEEQVAALG